MAKDLAERLEESVRVVPWGQLGRCRYCKGINQHRPDCAWELAREAAAELRRLSGELALGPCPRKTHPFGCQCGCSYVAPAPPAGETARERIAEIRRHREKGWTAHWSEVEWLMAEWDRLAAQLAEARKQAFEDGIAAIQRNIDLDAIAATSGGECIAILQALKETR